MLHAPRGRDASLRTRVARALVTALAAAFVGAPLACASLSGLTGGTGEPDAAKGLDGGCAATGTCFALPDSSIRHDQHASDAHRRPDAAVHLDAGPDAPLPTRDAAPDQIDAPVCSPVALTKPSYPEGGACPIPDAADAGCHVQGIKPSALAWVPPHPHETACTATEIASIAASSTPTLSNQCAACFFSLTTYANYSAEVDFPQVTFVGYGFANTAGCIATLEPCNQPCAELLLSATLCPSLACLPSCLPTSPQTYTDMIPCLNAAQNGCPCASVSAAANACVNGILVRNSPAAACFGPPTVPGETQQEQYYKELAAVTNALCGGAVDAGK